MTVVDTSALIAILKGEPEKPAFSRLLAGGDANVMSAIGLLEAFMVLGGNRPDPAPRWRELEDLISGVGMTVLPFDQDQARHARDAFLRFGKGRHPAALNMGDCAAYALASSRGLPLLFKGNDFPRTDITPAAGS